MPQTFEEQYAEVLQNIEFAIVETYRQMPELLDYHVDAALETAIAGYSAKQQGRTPRPVTLEGARLRVDEAVRNACEWRLGREEIRVGNDARHDEPLQPKRLDEIVSCLKRVRKSAQRWTREGDARLTVPVMQAQRGARPALLDRQRESTGKTKKATRANAGWPSYPGMTGR